MKTVFFLNCTDSGSTGKIIKDTAVVAKEHGYRSVLCTPVVLDSDSTALTKHRVSNRLSRALAYRISKITGNRYGKGSFTTAGIIRKIQKEKADLVHIHCANGNFMNIYSLLSWLKKKQIPTVLTNHAEFFYTGNCPHAFDCDRWMTGCGKCPQKFSKIDTTAKWHKKMQKSFAGFSNLIVTSVSPWVKSRAEKSPIMTSLDHRLVTNGVDTAIFHNCPEENLWQRYGIQPNGRRIILYVTACFYGDRPEKGSQYLLRLAEKMADQDVLFVVAGNHVANVEVPDNIVLLGRISDQKELAALYSTADLTLITSQRETFSMPVAESMCCGTPIAGFRAGGPESIALSDYSEFVEFGDVESLKNVIAQKWLQFKTPGKSEEISDAAIQIYDKSFMANQYISIYGELTGAKNNEW